ncbi:MAG: DUF1579 family protein [Deltaproteobacteria bacterium]|nr:DUF1579 family protein [Deltaproteobacteria bacterium]
MTVTAFYNRMAGDWRGTCNLWFGPGEPVRTCDTEARVRAIAGDAYHLMTYRWVFEGEAKEGALFLGGHEEAATATWGDSWHMAPDPMVCQGLLEDGGAKLVFPGNYPTGPDTPDWGWRTELTWVDGDGLIMEAYNITPEGEEAIAVRAEYRRA